MDAMGRTAGIATAATAYSTRPGQTRRAMVSVTADICRVTGVGTAMEDDA
ncbi:MAG: hypothetical protein ABGY24_18385 [bacterium]|jgi:hypothetical protein